MVAVPSGHPPKPVLTHLVGLNDARSHARKHARSDARKQQSQGTVANLGTKTDARTWAIERLAELQWLKAKAQRATAETMATVEQEIREADPRLLPRRR